MATLTLFQVISLLLGIPAATWALVQVCNYVYNCFSKHQPVPVAPDGTPVSYKKTKALTWTTEVKVIEKK